MTLINYLCMLHLLPWHRDRRPGIDGGLAGGGTPCSADHLLLGLVQDVHMRLNTVSIARDYAFTSVLDHLSGLPARCRLPCCHQLRGRVCLATALFYLTFSRAHLNSRRPCARSAVILVLLLFCSTHCFVTLAVK